VEDGISTSNRLDAIAPARGSLLAAPVDAFSQRRSGANPKLMSRTGRKHTLLKYLLVQVPEWTVAVVLVWMLHRHYALPLWAGLLLASTWIAKDLALYPRMRAFYESNSAEPRIVGETGTAVTELAPRGFVRVYGELWQAEAAGGERVPEGFTVCVRDIRGLLLIVEPVPVEPAARRSITPGTRD
jgi:membrane protein implicated in regulation of membrane protease activity